jgi:hypothetical protein
MSHSELKQSSQSQSTLNVAGEAIRTHIKQFNDESKDKLLQIFSTLTGIPIHISARLLSYKCYEVEIAFEEVKTYGYGASDREAKSKSIDHLVEHFLENSKYNEIIQQAVSRLTTPTPMTPSRIQASSTPKRVNSGIRPSSLTKTRVTGNASQAKLTIVASSMSRPSNGKPGVMTPNQGYPPPAYFTQQTEQIPLDAATFDVTWGQQQLTQNGGDPMEYASVQPANRQGVRTSMGALKGQYASSKAKFSSNSPLRVSSGGQGIEEQLDAGQPFGTNSCTELCRSHGAIIENLVVIVNDLAKRVQFLENENKLLKNAFGVSVTAQEMKMSQDLQLQEAMPQSNVLFPVQHSNGAEAVPTLQGIAPILEKASPTFHLNTNAPVTQVDAGGPIGLPIGGKENRHSGTDAKQLKNFLKTEGDENILEGQLTKDTTFGKPEMLGLSQIRREISMSSNKKTIPKLRLDMLKRDV